LILPSEPNKIVVYYKNMIFNITLKLELDFRAIIDQFSHQILFFFFL
jgi:hypothetical protein